LGAVPGAKESKEDNQNRAASGRKGEHRRRIRRNRGKRLILFYF